eukprot:TRINITY_DN4602_c0_g1_i1.p1 TRINITY_DN4602_c0_g1~~TRINITY_DN4602_c0_g1_i1.p1  ORF type:complete len:448 (-),score=56.70 TRINITY_DN4602_c0_g1_i1:8-1351(-)
MAVVNSSTGKVLDVALVDEFYEHLLELNAPERDPIANMTTVAAEFAKAGHSAEIVAAIELRLLQATGWPRLSAWYLIDSIASQVPVPYVNEFAAHLPELILKCMDFSSPEFGVMYTKLFKLWEKRFPGLAARLESHIERQAPETAVAQTPTPSSVQPAVAAMPKNRRKQKGPVTVIEIEDDDEYPEKVKQEDKKESKNLTNAASSTFEPIGSPIPAATEVVVPLTQWNPQALRRETEIKSADHPPDATPTANDIRELVMRAFGFPTDLRANLPLVEIAGHALGGGTGYALGRQHGANGRTPFGLPMNWTSLNLIQQRRIVRTMILVQQLYPVNRVRCPSCGWRASDAAALTKHRDDYHSKPTQKFERKWAVPAAGWRTLPLKSSYQPFALCAPREEKPYIAQLASLPRCLVCRTQLAADAQTGASFRMVCPRCSLLMPVVSAKRQRT